MAESVRPITAIGSAGAFTASSGTLAAAVSAAGGAYAISGPTSTQFFGSTAAFDATEPINSVTIRVTCRLATAGARSLSVGVRPPGTSLLAYHDTVPTVASTDWVVHTFTWPTNPDGGAPWTATNVNDIARIYVRANLVDGDTTLHVDLVEMVVDYGTTDPEPPAETTIPGVASIYVGADPVARIMLDGAQVWPTHIPAPGASATWAEAFATRNFPGNLHNWFNGNTGHDPTLTYTNVTGGLTVDPAWLAANDGNGRVFQSGGRWFVERHRCTGTLTIDANNVTLTNMHVDSTGALYGLRSTTNATGVVVEHSTVAGNGANDNGAAINFSDATTPGQIIMRYLDVSGFRAGLYSFGGTTAEYCWVHGLHYSTGSHNTGASIRGGNATLRRCLVADGNSAAVSLYPEIGPYTNVLVEECALRLPESDTGPELLLASGRTYSEPEPGDTRRIIGNLFYRGGNVGGGGIGGYLAGFTEVVGNIDRNGAPVG